MRFKLLKVVALSLVVMTSGCSMFERLVYHPDINQGNYLTPAEVAKVQQGMTQQQVQFALGTPMLKDPFGSQTWYYVFREEPGHQEVRQETLTLTFDSNGILTKIDKQGNMPNFSAPATKS
ncbi:outer membrane protein assembly factor BamE [Proteus terrae]|uniref:outer membrane protein assembly factor BamE n=1 Tax=Proteus terrae TaxID=1574161 RepID=UPI0034D5ED9F